MKIDETTINMIESNFASGDHGNTVFLAGEPAIGKTSLFKALAKRWNSEAFVVSVNQMADKADLTGARLVKSDDGKTFEQRFFAHHKVRKAVQFALDNPSLPVLLILDEINRSTADVTSGALSMSTERELGDSRFPDNLHIGVTGNIRGNVTALDSASLSRFVIYQVEPDAPTLIKYLDSRDNGQRPMNPWCKAVLTNYPNTVFQVSRPQAYTLVDGDDDDDPDTVMAGFADLNDASEEMLQLTAPRTIEGLSDWLDAISNHGTDMSTLMELFQTQVEIGNRETTQLNEVIEAHIGNTDFCTYLVQEISNTLMTTGTNGAVTNRLNVDKPRIWTMLKSVNTITDLDRMVGTMDNADRSKALAYALYDRNDNSEIIRQLIAQMSTIEEPQFRLIGQLFASGRIDEHNKDAAINIVGAPVAERISSVARVFS